MELLHEHVKRNIARLTIAASILAGILYSSWPLGFLVNPIVSRHDFASELEASHQPYNWLFIALDILTGVILMVSGAIQWRKSHKSLSLKLSILGYVLFGVLVIAAAIAPYNCNSIAQSCLSMDTQPAFLIHGFSSIFSVVFLFISLLVLCKMLYEQREYFWLSAITVLMLCWGVTGLYALVQLDQGVKHNWVQYLFITVCSVSIVLSVSLVELFCKQLNQVAGDKPGDRLMKLEGIRIDD